MKFNNIKYRIKELRWIKAFFSPFKRPKLKVYLGKTQVGVPYFLPRKWVKANHERATKATLDFIQKQKDYNERNPDYSFKIEIYDKLYADFMKRSYAVPLKFGFNSCGLGWKTKWSSTDIRHEYNPVFSFVFFGFQLAISVIPNHDMHYWEAWIYYEYYTDKKKSRKERIKQCKEKFPLDYCKYEKDTKIMIHYYPLILKKKYL